MNMTRRVALAAMMVAIGLTSAVGAQAHPTNPLEGRSDIAQKAHGYTGEVADPSPGDVPMKPLSDVRCEDGMAGIFPCHKVDLASFTPLPELEATFVNDIWGWEDSLTGMQIAIVGTFEGTAFVDVTNGTEPVYLGTLPSSFPGDEGNIWGDVRVYGDTAYIVAEAFDFANLILNPELFLSDTIDGFGIQVVDLTQFRGATAPIDVVLEMQITDVSQSHNVTLNVESGRLYVLGAFVGVQQCRAEPPPFGLPALPIFNGNGGALVYDVSTDPLAPEHIGCLTGDGYIHDMQCVNYDGPDADYDGREICVASNEDTVTLYDVTDIANPVVLDSLTYLGAGITPDQYYTHQGWFSEDLSYFFLGDEVDELTGAAASRTTYIWDMTDLDDVQLLGAHTDGNTSIDHNMFVLDGLLYQSNYTSGLWLYDAWKADQGRLAARGYFDVYPAHDLTTFAGTWGNYPYFGDGKVVVTSSDEGLFVLQSRAKSSSTNRGRGK